MTPGGSFLFGIACALILRDMHFFFVYQGALLSVVGFRGEKVQLTLLSSSVMPWLGLVVVPGVVTSDTAALPVLMRVCFLTRGLQPLTLAWFLNNTPSVVVEAVVSVTTEPVKPSTPTTGAVDSTDHSPIDLVCCNSQLIPTDATVILVAFLGFIRFL
jgi:hypothetical protein